ncbi:MAG: MerR family transcriptional regulator [bacterium]|nr:MerR family transcriptional regulator [bacterium]
MAAPMDYPKKLYYSISEVPRLAASLARAALMGNRTLSPHLEKTRAGSRRYRQSDIESVLAIKELLYVQGFKIAGARKALRQEKAAEAAPNQPA